MPLQFDREIIRPQIAFTSTVQDHNVYKNDFSAQNTNVCWFSTPKGKGQKLQVEILTTVARVCNLIFARKEKVYVGA